MKERTTDDRLTLLPITRSLLHQIEEDTARPVVIRADARVRERGRAVYVASDPDPTRHLILYDPAQERHLDHLVAHECGHTSRLAEADPSERVVPVLTEARRAGAAFELLPELSRIVQFGVPEGLISEMLTIWLGGTIVQVANTPADIHIETNIYESMPELRRRQAESLVEQLNTVARAMRPVVAGFTPEPVWQASNAMNCAFAKALSRLLDKPELIQPYRHTSAEKLAAELLAIDDAHPDSGLTGDVAAADLWAEMLGVRDWYEWRTLESLPAGARGEWRTVS
jgi:hypothetical protein